MYLPTAHLTTAPLCLFTAADGHASSRMKPECAWRDPDGVVRVGTWLGEWQRIERAWALDTFGNWQGNAPMLYQPFSLRARTGSGAEIAPTREGDDPVWHLASGEPFKLDWLCRTVLAPEGLARTADAHYEIRSAATGSLVRTGAPSALPLSQAALPDGSYVAYVQYLGIHEGLRLPSGYERDPQYDYQTVDNRNSHYNPVLFVGEVPADENHPLNLLRRELIAANTQQDNPGYSRYLTSEAAQNGEGSAIKLHVGAGAWSLTPGVFVTPSRALCELDFTTPATLPEGTSPSTPIPVQVDPLAHVFSKVLYTRQDGPWNGKILLGGARFSPDGARPSLWQWNEDNTVTLLGSALQACDPICEELLSTGLVTALTELQDGSIILLTLCSRHRYDARGALPETRLPRYPLASDGEPGGRSMTAIGAGIGTRVFHTTESLGREPDPSTENFYNITIDIQGEKVVLAGGTFANVDGCLWRHRGKTFGVTVRKADKQTYIANYDGQWNPGRLWRSDWISLQRGISLNGLSLAFGYIPHSQTARAIRDDGHRTAVLTCDYRLREGTVTRHPASPYLQSYLAPAHKVIANQLDTAWSLIELDGRAEDDEGEDGVLPTPDPLDDLEDGDHRFYRVLELPAHNPIHALQIRDSLASLALQAANADPEETLIGVRLRVDSTAGLDDIASYIWRPDLRRAFTLPIAAQSKIEMLVVTREELAPEQLPIIGVEV